MLATILNSDLATLRAIQIVTVFTDLERMAHGEEPKQPGFAEAMQAITAQGEVLQNSHLRLNAIVEKIAGGVSDVKQDITETQEKIETEITP